MIPQFDAVTGNLPPGIHQATWSEFVARYGHTSHRLALLTGLKLAIESLSQSGCKRVYVNGSFVSSKEVPGDFDACWEVNGVDPDLLDPVLLDFNDMRAAQKARFGGEFFPVDSTGSVIGIGTEMLRFFQRDKSTGKPKGIVMINLGDSP